MTFACNALPGGQLGLVLRYTATKTDSHWGLSRCESADI